MLKSRRVLLTALAFVLIASAAWGASARSNMPAGVQSFAPTGTVPDNVSFRAVFRNPVVNKNQTGKVITPENSLFPFEVNPPLQLEGRWQNERTFTAKLLSPLRSATTYTATLRDDLKDRRGNKIGPGTFRFQTEGLSPTDVKASMGRDGNAYFTLSFNMRIDPARLKGFMRIINEEGREMPYNINGGLPSRVIRVAVPVDRTSSRQRFTVKIAAGLKSGEGDLGFDKDFSESVVLDPVLMVQNIYKDENEIRATFNFGIDPNTAKSFINIEPSVSDVRFESSWSDETIIMRSSEFKPRSRFVITFRKGFPSKGGLVLKEDYKQAVIMPDLDSQISLPASGSYLTALDKGLIPVELLNVKKLQIDLWRMYENNIPYVLHGDYDSFQKDIAKRVFTNEIPLSLPLNERVRRSIPVEDMAKGERGLFLLTVRDTEKSWWDEETQIINLSDMGATARLWDNAILIWVNTLTTARGINEATVKIYSDRKQLLAEGKTNNGGVFYYELPEGSTWSEENKPDVAIISKKSGEHTDLTYVQLTRNLLNREIFETSGREWLRSGYDAVIFSPRDIYRTGESATFKALVRNFDMTTPEAFPVLFIVKDTLGRKVKQEAITLNARGSAVAELNLPSNALTGLWTASLAIPGNENKPIALYNFHVEDFAPPRIEVKLNSYKQYLIHGDTFNADIYARWLFGADGAGLNYKTSWTAREGNFTPAQDRWKEYSFGDPSVKFTFTEGIIDEGKQLDNFGAAKTEFKLEEDWHAPTIINVTLKTEVMEDGGRWVSSSITRPYFAVPFLLGIAPVDENITVRNKAKFKVAGITPDEEPANPGELDAQLFKITWNYNMVEIDGRKRWQSSEELTEVEKKSLTLKNGLGEVDFTPEEYGSYMVLISDPDDNTRAVYRFYATDPKYAGGGAQLIDRLEMTTEKEFYKLGEKAKIKIKAPFEGLMLITVENANLVTRNVQIVDKSEVEFEVPVVQALRPNFWVSAWLVRPVTENDAKGWASHRAIGLMRVKTDISDFNIDVAIDAPKKIEPASKLPVTIKLKGASDAITQNSDVAIAFVDDGVLGLTRYKTPDLLNHFWGLKRLNSEGFDIYDQLIPVEDRATEQLHPAGDEAMGALANDGSVQRFKILSLFEGVLYPDKNGEIKTELDIPEFSGRGRLFVVAASGRSFGKAEQKIEIARDIVTETGLPRFAAPGDVFAVPVSIFNTSSANKNVKINLTPEGLMLKESFKEFDIAAGSKANFNTQARALGGNNKAVLKITTSWEENGVEKAFTQEVEMPVRSAWPNITLGGSGIFSNGKTELGIPLNNFVGNVEGTLTLADTPAVNVTKAADFLNKYPYACLEQTISTAWPFLILPDAVAELDPLLTNDTALHERTDSAITRIQSMQLYDGSFSMWPGSNTTFEWGSVYAVHFLLSAKNAGINYPEEMFTGALNWLRQFLASMPAFNSVDDERDDLTIKAYAVYVLALNGEKPLGWIEYIRENQNNLRPSGHIYLAGAQSLIDGNADALRNLELGRNSGYSGRTLESETRNTAVLLQMWLDVEPQAPEVTELASRLIDLGSKGSWFSTQDNSASLIALARYNVEAAGAKSSIKARLTTDTSDSSLLTFSSNAKPSSIKVNDLPKKSGLLIEAEGDGQGFYAWSINGFPKSQPKAERRNLNVECVYFDESGNVLNLAQPIEHGKIVQVVLTLKPSMTINNLALNYLLPAGFELENPRLDDGAEYTPGSYGVVNDVRDDRLILFFDRLSGERSYGFKMRAVTRGTFKVPQISAYGMYDASIRFTGSAQPDIVIK
ncbi:MAG: MG2 domain-containing protein [Synergistales bacterium]|nr:MG2 domain-containing protein [Synergistales bacterium]MDY6400695.1 MG2 domain-containing protein [Synergistales bacterium]MDY6405030.1 MG2 domain-containing protein [Synergistales bacterium]MDY6410101.1 MG2 domain-containing protein [Synergistales bacterium]MDY6413801.1 MG2 domain-containing protein [Synergistales bacterium]